MSEQDKIKRVAEILGFVCVGQIGESLLVEQRKPKDCRLSIPGSFLFTVNSDFAICRMIDKLRSDGYTITISPTEYWATNIDPRKPNSQPESSLFEVFCKVYGVEND